MSLQHFLFVLTHSYVGDKSHACGLLDYSVPNARLVQSV